MTTNHGRRESSCSSPDAGFSALYEATAADLLKFLLRRTPTPEDAADCLAEAFLIAWNKRHELPSQSEQARPWLFGVARNVLKRDRRRDVRVSAASAELARELGGAQRQIPEHDLVAAALQQLSPVDREIIEMLVWDELAPREVAAILELSPNVVRIRAHRARIKLREELKPLTTTRQISG
jgi:RNA polymerase sigma-70 factor (ECF subfamily)